MKRCLLLFFLSTFICGISMAQTGKQTATKAKPAAKTSTRKTDAQLYAEQLKAEAKPVKAKAVKN